ncbi:MAG: pyridoxal phosphate-dependent aminotransferase family protein [Pricia sp.]
MGDREVSMSMRKLPGAGSLMDFSSNDYLGFSGNREIFDRAHQILSERKHFKNGATGSRLLSGNHPLYSELERKLAEFHQTESALVFNSGYDANIGFFGCVPQRGDIVFYDELVHASIRDGITMGNAKSYKFGHNDLEDLSAKLNRMGLMGNRLHRPADDLLEMSDGDSGASSGGESTGQSHGPTSSNDRAYLKPQQDSEVYIVTESVFSMDGDSPNLEAFAVFCQRNGYRFIVDEAHAVGVFGKRGEGLVQHLNLQGEVFARIITFGKSIGCHGAAILGSADLKKYLVNFARSMIYTTGLPPHSVATILSSYEQLIASHEKPDEVADQIRKLTENILFFNRQLEKLELVAANVHPQKTEDVADLKPYFIPSTSAIHCCIIPGNERATEIAEKLQSAEFDIRPILAPTVPAGQERIRICLHNFNTEKEINEMLTLLSESIRR